jgi:1,4-dihydroxy-6-naphthoate synthase
MNKPVMIKTMNSPVHQFTRSPVISLAFSPCPNDTFIFDAMVHSKIDMEGLEFDYRMADVEELNQMAFMGQMEMLKVSYHAWLYLREDYILLESGSAMGFGNGPMIIGRKQYSLNDLESLTIAIPGRYTTANLLLKIFAPKATGKKIMVFNEIEDAVLNGTVDAGVIIHENRFTYQDKGLVKISDLGEQWEHLTHCPIPLGAIIVKRSLGNNMIGRLNRIMRRSVEFAMTNPGSSMPFVRQNAQEMDEAVMRKHIQIYVNEFTVDMGEKGKKAIHKLSEAKNDLI